MIKNKSMLNKYKSEVVFLNNPYELNIQEEELSHINNSELLCETVCTAISPGS